MSDEYPRRGMRGDRGGSIFFPDDNNPSPALPASGEGGMHNHIITLPPACGGIEGGRFFARRHERLFIVRSAPFATVGAYARSGRHRRLGDDRYFGGARRETYAV